ncbi:Lysine histidine transporter 1 [Aphelenchoides fujianensis]|nr:Lysine histidine transporter 1 [Aphelenchoides fujianensis]
MANIADGSTVQSMDTKKSRPEFVDSNGDSAHQSGSLNAKGRFVRHHGLSRDRRMPAAIAATAVWPGLLFAAFVCLISMFTSVFLGRCWAMLQERYPKAMGTMAKHVVSGTIQANQFGVCVVYLLPFCAKSINDALTAIFHDSSLHYCIITVLLALLLFPITLLKSPEDFWPVVIGGMCCSALAVILIFVGSGFDYGLCSQHPVVRPVDPFSSSFGHRDLRHSSFATIQHDMRKPYQFNYSSYLAFGIILCLYLPMSTIANLTYGGDIQASIINNIQTPWIQQSINGVLLLHFLLTLRVEASGRAGATMTVILATGLTIPSFGPLLNLVGASTTLLTVLVYPVLFYMQVPARHGHGIKERNKTTGSGGSSAEYPSIGFFTMLKNTDTSLLVGGFVIMAIGLFICFFSSISALIELTGSNFEAPCFVQWARGGGVMLKGSLPTSICFNVSRLAHTGAHG